MVVFDACPWDSWRYTEESAGRKETCGACTKWQTEDKESFMAGGVNEGRCTDPGAVLEGSRLSTTEPIFGNCHRARQLNNT